MKNLSIAAIFISVFMLMSAQDKPKRAHIHWYNLEQAQLKMSESPKKLFVDLYTDWCGWCKVMDRKSFEHPVIIELMNKYFYAVKFNAEKEDSLTFNGQKYKLLPRGGKPLHQWAKKFGSSERGLSYPTTIYFTEQLQLIQSVPGYLEPAILEKILVYLGEDHALNGVSWPDFEKSFKGRVVPEKGK